MCIYKNLAAIVIEIKLTILIIIIIGENEYSGNFFTIKNLITSEQKELKLNQISNHLNDKSR